MTYETLQIEMHDQVVVLTVARPEKLNALDHRTIGELHRAFEAFAGDDSIRAVVVTGAGEKAFVAGADIVRQCSLRELIVLVGDIRQKSSTSDSIVWC